MGKPNVATYNAATAYKGITTQYSSIRIDYYIILYSWVALNLSVFFGNTKRSQRNTLVYLYIVTYLGRFANNNARTMVYGKALAYACTGVYIYTCFAVYMLCKNTGQFTRIFCHK